MTINNYYLHNSSSHRIIVLTGRLSGGQRYREEVSFCGEDVIINIDGQLALLRKQQVQVFKHLSQKEGVHPTHTFTQKQML